MNTKKVMYTIIMLIAFYITPVSAQDWSPSRIVGIDYPVLAIQAAIAGTVRIKCVLDDNGKVLSTEILEAVGSSGTRNLLGKAAQENASQWVFSRSSPIAQEPRFTIITYEFRFEVKPNPAYLRSRFIFDFPQTVHVVAEVPPAQPTK